MLDHLLYYIAHCSIQILKKGSTYLVNFVRVITKYIFIPAFRNNTLNDYTVQTLKLILNKSYEY
jgi:hypothetical protein